MRKILVIEDDYFDWKIYEEKTNNLQIDLNFLPYNNGDYEAKGFANGLKGYDLIIIDGLGGECFKVYEKSQKICKTMIITGDESLVKICKEKNIEVYEKDWENLKLEEILK